MGEPLYIKVHFRDFVVIGRGAKAIFWIYQKNEWITFAKIYKADYIGEKPEDEEEYLEEYRYVWQLVRSELASRIAWQEPSESYMVRITFSPDFSTRDEFNAFLQKRINDEKAPRSPEFDGSSPSRKKRRIESLDG